LKSKEDENEKLRIKLQDYEDRFKRIEAQMQEKPPSTAPLQQSTQLNQTQNNQGYSPHQISQAARISSTYQTHGAERAMNHGQSYPTQLAAAGTGKNFLLHMKLTLIL
jgi:hypothetical protein